MNRKMVLILVAVVATVLPAVAVADVLVVGYAGGTGVQVSPAFYIQHGENYMAAKDTTGFKWVSNEVSYNEYLGNFTIGYMTNETIYEINVLDINFTSTTASDFSIGITVSHPFPSGSAIYFSTAPFSFVKGMISSNVESLSLSSTAAQTPLEFTGMAAGTTIYVAFSIGSGTFSSSNMPSFTLTFSDAPE
ncbi:MAG: hypothetical protein ACP5UV_04935 [Thermoplasmata archaeon]